MAVLKAIPMTRDSARGYAEALTDPAGPPAADEAAFRYWEKVARFELGRRASAGLLACRRRSLVVDRLERHRNTPELLVALSGDSLVCLAPAAEELDGGRAERLRVFLVRQGEAFLLAPGTWHGLPYPLAAPESRFLVVFRADTESTDLEIRSLAPPVELTA
jgi:ureidoglycolate hydrolase